MVGLLTNNDYRASIIVSEKNGHPVAQFENDLLTFKDSELATFSFIDQTDVKRKSVLSKIGAEEVIISEGSRTMDSATMRILDPSGIETSIDRQDEIILSGIETCFHKEGNPSRLSIRVSSLIRESYFYDSGQPIKDKEYKDFMDRLRKLSLFQIKIMIAEKNNPFIDPENGHEMRMMNERLLTYKEITNEIGSAKDWLVIDRPISYSYALQKGWFTEVNKSLLTSENKRQTEKYRILRRFVVKSIDQYIRAYVNSKNKDKLSYKPVILWETLFFECGYADKTPSFKSKVKDIVFDIFKELKEENKYILSWELHEVKKKHVGISYVFNPEYKH